MGICYFFSLKYTQSSYNYAMINHQCAMAIQIKFHDHTFLTFLLVTEKTGCC